MIETVRCDSPQAAVAAADRVRYPAVVKVDHPDLTHKSDVGGVRLGLADADAVGDALAEGVADDDPLADGVGVGAVVAVVAPLFGASRSTSRNSS